MKLKLIYTTIGITSLILNCFFLQPLLHRKDMQNMTVMANNNQTAVLANMINTSILSSLSTVKLESALNTAASESLNIIKFNALDAVKLATLSTVILDALNSIKLEKPSITKTDITIKKKNPALNSPLKQISFEQLPGWKTSNVKKSLLAFKVSCKTFLKQDPSHRVGTQNINLQAKDWQPACRQALSVDSLSEESARAFFEKWFLPIAFFKQKPIRGIFTGYYMPLIPGRLTKTKKYNTPIYGLPTNMITSDLGEFDPKLKNKKVTGRVEKKKFVSYYTREQIEKGALTKKATAIAWIENPVDRLFLEIEGSGAIKLPNGKRIYLSYAGENGAPYTSIAHVLISKGVMTKDNASTKGIKKYLDRHPKEKNAILNKNKSFVFFQKLKQNLALGAQGVALTPGYSLAIDKKKIPLGAPLWVATTRPAEDSDNDKQLRRLMIAQDTGGAIRGLVRGDIFWGAGKKANFLATNMKNEGYYWLLLPKHIINRLIL